MRKAKQKEEVELAYLNPKIKKEFVNEYMDKVHQGLPAMHMHSQQVYVSTL